MRVLIGCPVVSRAWILPEWFDAIEAQGIECSVLVVMSPSADNTEEILKDRGAEILYDDRSSVRTETEALAHIWGKMDVYSYMAGLRNGLVAAAKEREADYFFSLDSDIILPPGALENLLRFAVTHKGVIAPAVNMTLNSVAWNVMDWVDRRQPNMAERRSIPERKSGPQDVVMAAMLLDAYGMDCQWRAHQQGEDVGFCIDAHNRGIKCWWVPEVRCQHIMRRY